MTTAPIRTTPAPIGRAGSKAAGIKDIEAQRGSRFNQSIFVLEAAANGLGIALAKSSLVQQDLADTAPGAA